MGSHNTYFTNIMPPTPYQKRKMGEETAYKMLMALSILGAGTSAAVANPWLIITFFGLFSLFFVLWNKELEEQFCEYIRRTDYY